MDRVEALQADIERAPAALGEVRDAYLGTSSPLDALSSEVVRDRRVAFVGLGSSMFASMDAASALRASGVAAWAEFASADGPPARDLVLVAVSASGRTREVVDIAHRHHGTSLVIGVTNVQGSPLAVASDVVLPLFAGIEVSGISTLTYRATVVVLSLLAGRFGLDIDADRFRTIDLGAGAGDSIPAWADLLDGAPSIDVIGPASRLGAVSQAALLLREAPRLPAHAYETADWLHTAVYLALPGHRAVLFPGSAADAEVLDTITRRGGEVIVLGEDPMIASATADRLALELWSRTA